MRLLIKSVRFINPYEDFDELVDVLLVDGVIAGVGVSLNDEDATLIDGTNQILAPGFIDMHVHLREPGQTHKETIYTGMQAAANGGFTSIACMPNTNPTIDNSSTLKFVLEKAEAGPIHVLPIAAISKGLAGETLTDMASLKKMGAVAFSDDGMGVMRSSLMVEAMRTAQALNTVVIDHCEDVSLDTTGVMNLGSLSDSLGYVGIPRAAEDIMTARDILLAKEYNLPVHIAHVSTKTAVSMIREAKASGIDVTSETTTHHFTLTEDVFKNQDPVYKVSPPLRTEEDRQAILEGIKDGTIDIIATDHAPHTDKEKNRGLIDAPKGMIGLETCLGLVMTYLVKPGIISINRAIEMLTIRAHQRFQLPAYTGNPRQGKCNLVLFDPQQTWTVNSDDFYSKSNNSPYMGMGLQGKVTMTIANGSIAMHQGQVTF